MKVEQQVVITINQAEFNTLAKAKAILLEMYDELNDECLSDLDTTESLSDCIICLRDIMHSIKIEP